MKENKLFSNLKKKSFWDRVTFGILLGVSFFAPVFFVSADFISTQFGTSLLFSLGVILALLVYIVSALFYGEVELPSPSRYVLGVTALVPVVYLLAGVANGFSRMSFFGYTFVISTVGFIILGFAYLYIISVVFNSKTRIFYSFFAFVVSALILSIFLLIRIIWGSDILSFGVFNTVTTSMLGSWNNVGIFFGVGVILSLLTHEIAEVSRIMRVLLVVSLALSLFFLALVNFGILWIIVGITTFLFIVYSLYGLQSSSLSLKQRIKRTPKLTSIVFVVSLIFVIWGTSIGAFLSNNLGVTNLDVRPGLSVTLDIARKTIMDKPLFGSGPNTFTTQWLTWKPDDVVSTVFWNTDFTNGIGLIPTFAVTTGIFGILSWLVFLGFYIYLGIKSIFHKTEDGFLKYLLLSSFFVSLYLWFMTFVYMPSTVIFILTLFFTGLFLSSVYLVGIISLETKKFSGSPKSGFLFSLVLVALFLASVSLGHGLYKNSESL